MKNTLSFAFPNGDSLNFDVKNTSDKLSLYLNGKEIVSWETDKETGDRDIKYIQDRFDSAMERLYDEVNNRIGLE